MAKKSEAIKKYVKEEEKDIKVNWRSLKCSKYYTSSLDEILDYLREKNFLSPLENNRFMVVGEGMDLSPMTSCHAHYYFARIKDAADYAKGFYGSAMYPVHIVQIKELNAGRK